MSSFNHQVPEEVQEGGVKFEEFIQIYEEAEAASGTYTEGQGSTDQNRLVQDPEKFGNLGPDQDRSVEIAGARGSFTDSALRP